ncbi:MAG: hypothetical protein C0478_11910 [Planctomyces sp.]|nr:hypothetical protein [Planctomyces sp.]
MWMIPAVVLLPLAGAGLSLIITFSRRPLVIVRRIMTFWPWLSVLLLLAGRLIPQVAASLPQTGSPVLETAGEPSTKAVSSWFSIAESMLEETFAFQEATWISLLVLALVVAIAAPGVVVGGGRAAGSARDDRRMTYLMLIQFLWMTSWLAADWRVSLGCFDLGWMLGAVGLLLDAPAPSSVGLGATDSPSGAGVTNDRSSSAVTGWVAWQGLASLSLLVAMWLLSAVSMSLKSDLVPVAPAATFDLGELVADASRWPAQNEIALRVWRTTSGGILLGLLIAIWIRGAVFPLHGWWASLVATQSLPLALVLNTGSALSSLQLAQRFLGTLFQSEWREHAPWLEWLAGGGSLWLASLALSRTDLRKLLGFATLTLLQLSMLAQLTVVPTGVPTSVVAAQQLLTGALLAGGVLLMLVAALEAQSPAREIDGWGGLSQQIPRWSRAFGLNGWLLAGGLPGAVGAGLWLLLTTRLLESSWWVLAILAGWMMLISTHLNLALRLLFGRPRSPRLPVFGYSPASHALSGEMQFIPSSLGHQLAHHLLDDPPAVRDLSRGAGLALMIVTLINLCLVWCR